MTAPRKARTAKVPPVPATVEELSRDGLLFLLRSRFPPDAWDLARARWHELSCVSDAASQVWRAAAAQGDAAFDAQMLAFGERGQSLAARRRLRKASEAFDAASAKRERLYAAYGRASSIADAFWEAHLNSGGDTA
ncbi:hypothetical protein ACQW02_25380 [Humitalea sp. 24SJ18S-53]|uniref:hypothetical protein n=1 Tax=Humitalea sp. 24SJ18S-53 TaxID=3422307 RepID=UPI003D679BE0